MVGVVATLLRGARLQDFVEAELRAGWVFVAAALLEAAVKRLALAGRLPPVPWGSGLELLALALIAYGLLKNLHLRGLWLVAIGFALNSLAILTHGGQMPVTAEALRRAGIARAIPILKERGDGLHVLVEPGAPLWWLGDVLPLRHQVISVGDVLILLGVALAAYEVGQQGKRRRMGAVTRDG